MVELSAHSLLIVVAAMGLVLLVELLLAIYVFASLRISATRQATLSKEMFGLMKKIEGLTATRRDQILVQYDKLLDTLAARLPTTIASKAGEVIFEAEQKILTRLAELEPNLRNNSAGLEKMEALIKSMENLEGTMVALTADTVQQVMLESRQYLFEEEKNRIGRPINLSH